jgi:hypothetical protein
MRNFCYILVFLFICGTVHGQTVKSLSTTNGTLQGTSLRINSATNFSFGGIAGSLQVEGRGTHAVAAKSTIHPPVGDEILPTADGAAFYGWSDSGSPVAKLAQSNYFTSAALIVWRPPGGDDSLSPTAVIAASPTNGGSLAIKVQRGTTNAWSVNYNGVAFSPPTSTVIYASSITIDWAVSSTFACTISANGGGPANFVFTNSTDGQTIVVRVTCSVPNTVTWPTTGTNDVKWAGGTEPTQTVGGTDIYTFVNIGGTIYGARNPDLR